MVEIDEFEVATKALDLQKEINLLTRELDVFKDRLRIIANGETKKIEVPGVGIVSISKPSVSTQKIVMIVNFEKLAENPDLKNKLLEKKIIAEEVKTTGGGAASVTLKPNV